MNFMGKLQPLHRYLLSGSMIFLLGHVQYRLVYEVLKGAPLRAGAAWVIHFIIGTFWSHAIHRGFTFRNEAQQPYLQSLLRTFGCLILLLGASTLLMLGICDVGGMQPVLGWFLTTAAAAGANFYHDDAMDHLLSFQGVVPCIEFSHLDHADKK